MSYFWKIYIRKNVAAVEELYTYVRLNIVNVGICFWNTFLFLIFELLFPDMEGSRTKYFYECHLRKLPQGITKYYLYSILHSEIVLRKRV